MAASWQETWQYVFAHHAHQAADDSASQPREDWAAAAAADGHQAADDGVEEDEVFDGVWFWTWASYVGRRRARSAPPWALTMSRRLTRAGTSFT